MKWQEDATKIVQERGHLIFGSSVKLSRGATISSFCDENGTRYKHPFRVVGETNRPDFVAQLAVLGIGSYSEQRWPYYYIVETD